MNVPFLGVDETGHKLHLDLETQLRFPATLKFDDGAAIIAEQDDQIITIEGDWLLEEGSQVDVIEHDVTASRILARLEDFWKKKMAKRASFQRLKNGLESSTLPRVYIPEGQMQYTAIGVDEWTRINRRYGPNAARGPDWN